MNKSLNNSPRTIIALDFETEEELFDLLDQFQEPVYVKVGMELFYGNGPAVISKIKAKGHQIFVDLKLHDIPHTVKQGMKKLAKLNVDMVNVHCGGGVEMMKAALQGLEEGSEYGKRPICIGVTQLTSTSQEIMNDELLIPGRVAEIALQYARLAQESGLDGVVCSVHESRRIHEVCGAEFLTVTPGIRLSGNSADDQKRIATPEEAVKEQCDYIVVGRSITTSPNPVETYKQIEKVMEESHA